MTALDRAIRLFLILDRRIMGEGPQLISPQANCPPGIEPVVNNGRGTLSKSHPGDEPECSGADTGLYDTPRCHSCCRLKAAGSASAEVYDGSRVIIVDGERLSVGALFCRSAGVVEHTLPVFRAPGTTWLARLTAEELGAVERPA
jgi:hypothetical protein